MATSIIQSPLWSYGRAHRYLLTTTSLTDVLTIPVVDGNVGLLLWGSIVVVVAATVVTAQVQWTDPDGGAQSIVWLNAQTLNPNVYPLSPIGVLAQQGTTVTFQVQAGTANQVRATFAAWGED
jgi:hypothetical protein